MKNSNHKILFLLLLLPLMGSQCDDGVLFKEITPTDLAAPIAVSVDTAKRRAYVVNSNNNVEFTSTHFSILDLADPTNPVLLNNAQNPIPIPNFSGQVYLDAAAGLLYTPNRESDNPDDTTDVLLAINVDEASADFGRVDSFAAGENPFGVACCDALGRIYVVNSGGDGDGTLDVYDPADLSTFVRISLAVVSDEFGTFNGEESTEVVLLGDRAFVTSRFGNIYVINTSEVGDTSKNPIDAVVFNDDDGDYRGIATDGTLLYVADADENSGEGLPALRVLDPASIPVVDPDVPTITELDIASVQTAQISLPEDGQPNEVAVFNGRAYVSNQDDDTVSVIDLATNSLSANISVGEEPFGITPFTLDGTDYVYVTNLRSNSISVVDPATNTVINTFAP
jgi:YVTN family beta-propeller protein